MKFTRSVQFLPLLVIMTLGVAACDGEVADLTTTSVLVTDSDGPVQATTTTVTVATEETTPIVRGQSVDSYQVVGRVSGDQGETLYIVIPTGAYTDVDLENFILDLYESGQATYSAEVFDDSAAVDAYLKAESERTEAEQELVAKHHFVSLVDGAVIRFQGPYASTGEMVIGS